MSNGSWRVDETYVRVKGRWTYLYRAVDSRGQTIDFLPAAHVANPRTLTVDKNPAYPRAVADMKSDGQLSRRTCLRQCKYLTDVFDKGLPRPHGGLVVVQANAERFPSRRAAGEATRTAKSGSVTRLPRDRRRLALTERARRYRSRPGGWTTIAIVLGYCSSGDHVAKSRVEVPALSRSL